MATRWTQADVDAVLRRNGVTTWTVPPAQPKPSKYGNRKVTDAEGNVHDSGKEHRRWCELQLRERAGEITELRRQVPYALVVNGVLVCQYNADFVYRDGAAVVVEDCKSPPTRKLPAYRIKVKLMAACHGIQIREV
jgi:hypothetical protein